MFGTGDIPLYDMHEIGGTPLEAPDEYRLRSPVSYLANANTPVLLLHHEGDLRCPIGQSEEIFHTLKMLGKEVEVRPLSRGIPRVQHPRSVPDYRSCATYRRLVRPPRPTRRKDSHERSAHLAAPRRRSRARGADIDK